MLLYKSNKTIWMFYGKFADEEDNRVNNPSIYNVDGDNRLSPGLQQVAPGLLPPVNLKCIESLCFFQSGSIIIFSIPEIILLHTTKQNSQVLIILE
jgi:hypothetical protein